MTLSDSTKRAMATCPDEAKIVRKIIRTLKEAGDPVTGVFDGVEYVQVSGEHSILEVVFSVDQSWLYTKSGKRVLIILGNGEDALSDYSTDLEETLTPFWEWHTKTFG